MKLSLIIANDYLSTDVKKTSILDIAGELDALLIDDSCFNSDKL